MRRSATVISVAALVVAGAALLVPSGTHLGEHLLAWLVSLWQQPRIREATWVGLGVFVLSGLLLAIWAWRER